MRNMSWRLIGLAGAMVISAGISAPPAQAGYVVTLTQSGSNVVANGSGIIDTTGLVFSENTGAASALTFPIEGELITGLATTSDLYDGSFTPFSGFGSGGQTFASSASGDIVDLDVGSGFLYLPTGYSGASLMSSATWDNTTLAMLGATPGTYEWTWGSGANQNFTLDVVAPAAVPESSSLALLALPLGLTMLLTGWRGAKGF